jgi:hypothetical protein
MELSDSVFKWLKALNVFQDAHVAKKKKTSFVMTPEATKAILSGHAVYYATCYFCQLKGIPVTQQPEGSPGADISSDAAHYNWSIVCQLLGNGLGVGLSPDHRMLLGNRDPGIIADLLSTLSKKLTPPTAPKQPHTTSLSPEPKGKRSRSTDPTDRTGAVSVDQGKARIARRKRQQEQDGAADESGTFDVFKDLERIRKKREEKLQRQRELEEREKEKTERFMKEMREKLSQDQRSGLSLIDVTASPLPCFKEFANKNAVHICHDILNGILREIYTGEAQAWLQKKEQDRRQAQETRKNRRQDGRDSMVPSVAAAPAVTAEKGIDHRVLLMCKDLCYELVDRATNPNIRDDLAKREAARQAASTKALLEHAERLYERRPEGRKKFHEERLDAKQEEERQKKLQEKRLQRQRKEIEDRLMSVQQQMDDARKEKEVAAQLEQEREKKREAQKMLYYAEQKAKVLESRRAKQLEEEVRKARQAELEANERESKKLQAQQIAKRLLEKEMQRDAAGAKCGAPTSLSPVSIGTGQRSGYNGPSLGWQFFTNEELALAELLLSVRSNPLEAHRHVEMRTQRTKGGNVWFTDAHAKRHPMALAEGPGVHDAVLEHFQQRFNTKRPPVEFEARPSIALTLAARAHAVDLAYHGIADPTKVHIGSDGSSASQRVMRFGTGLGGPGTTQEIVVSVVRPIDVELTAHDVLCFALVDDGCPGRENRDAVMRSVAASSGSPFENVGVGRAVATFLPDTAVEVYVVLFAASTFTDKTVPQMAAAQHQVVQSLAEPFLGDVRLVSKAIQAKLDLYKLTNVAIGSGSAAADTKALVNRLSRKPKRMEEYERRAAEIAKEEEEAEEAERRRGKKKRRHSKNSANGSAVFLDNDADRDAAEGDGPHSPLKRRLSSFFQKYAPEKLDVVDTALALNRGREEEMFAKLEAKYGPEPGKGEPMNDNHHDAAASGNELLSEVDEDEGQEEEMEEGEAKADGEDGHDGASQGESNEGDEVNAE